MKHLLLPHQTEPAANRKDLRPNYLEAALAQGGPAARRLLDGIRTRSAEAAHTCDDIAVTRADLRVLAAACELSKIVCNNKWRPHRIDICCRKTRKLEAARAARYLVRRASFALAVGRAGQSAGKQHITLHPRQ